MPFGTVTSDGKETVFHVWLGGPVRKVEFWFREPGNRLEGALRSSISEVWSMRERGPDSAVLSITDFELGEAEFRRVVREFLGLGRAFEGDTAADSLSIAITPEGGKGPTMILEFGSGEAFSSAAAALGLGYTYGIMLSFEKVPRRRVRDVLKDLGIL